MTKLSVGMRVEVAGKVGTVSKLYGLSGVRVMLDSPIGAWIYPHRRDVKILETEARQ